MCVYTLCVCVCVCVCMYVHIYIYVFVCVFTQGSLPPIEDGGGKFRPMNRKKINPNDLKKLAPQQRSRYLAVRESLEALRLCVGV